MSDITTKEFDERLSIYVEAEGADVLSIPGVYEILSEHFNNDILDDYESGL